MEQQRRHGRVVHVLAEFWRGRDVGIVYCCIVIVASTWIAVQPEPEVRRLVEQVSTNLDNMRSRHQHQLGQRGGSRPPSEVTRSLSS